MSRQHLIEILRRCDARGWSLSELARQANVRRNTLSRIVNGWVVPQRRTVEKLADALGTTPDVLMRRTDSAATGGADKKRDTDTELLLAAWRDLDEVNRQAALAFVEGLASSGQVRAAAVAAEAAASIYGKRRAAAAAAEGPPRRPA